MTLNENLFLQLKESSSFLKSKISSKPTLGVVLGSGLGEFANNIEVEFSIPFSQIPHFQTTTVEGHKGNCIIGKIAGHSVVALQGRYHYYEGHSMHQVVFPVRCLAMMGVSTLILTNSAGGLQPGMTAGDLMIIEDHINLIGNNPLMGPNLKELGPRFPDMTEAYDRGLLQKLEHAFQKLGLEFKKGIYCGLSGPTYETPAEVRFLRQIGCSAVGMSTVPECIAANHMGMRVVALSCITNLAAGISGHKLTHDEVTATAKKVERNFSAVLTEFISHF
jgi:purine-nucleoside phosphorylase